jgi:hypothetical protein
MENHMNDVLVMDKGTVWQVPVEQFAAYLRHRRAGHGVNLNHYGVLLGQKVVDITGAGDNRLAELCEEYWPSASATRRSRSHNQSREPT